MLLIQFYSQMTKNILKEILENNISNEEYLDKVISVFNEINNGIVRLYRFAGEDFKLMREQFKKFNRQSIRISENIDEAFALFDLQQDKKSFLQKIDEYKEKQAGYNEFIRKRIESYKELTSDFHKKTESILIPVKNLYQQIKSLKVLLTSLRLCSSAQNNQRSIQKKTDSLFGLIREIYTQFDRGIESTMTSLSNTIRQINEIEILNSEKLIGNQDKIEECKRLLHKKQGEVMLKNRELSVNVQENIGNSHKIVIELQYHDIIRQKIEHIMQVHYQIIDHLKKLKEGGDRENQDDIIRYLLQVGNIARIQASQLLYANREYESAIDVIGEKLLSFSGNMISIVDICNGFLLDKSENCMFGRLDDIINTHKSLRKRLFEEIQQVDEQLLTLHNKICFLKNNFSRITELIDNLISSLSFISEAETGEEQSKSILKEQAGELLKNIHLAESHFKDIFQNILLAESKSEFHSENKSENRNFTEEHKLLFDSLSNYEYELLPLITKEKDSLSRIYKENSGFTFDLTDKVLNIIRSVRYYEYFEILAEKITEKLNYLSETFHLEELSADIEDMEYIKEKYTMDSERIIHDNSVYHHGNNVELFEDFENTDKGKNVEFF